MTLLYRCVVAFFAVKLVNLSINLAAFPVLSPVLSPVPGTPGPQPGPRVSLLVPMRDERSRLAQTLPSIAAQDVDELIVLDDCSTDGSVGLAETLTAGLPHARVVAGSPAPAGWVGKTWACHQLSQHATGQVLMFCDADVAMAPGAVQAVLAQMQQQRADLLSVFARQDTGTLGEHLLVPLIDDVLLCFLAFPLLGIDVPSAATASGAVMAFRRSAYDALGGFAAVRGEVVDDVAMARHVRRSGMRLGLALGGSDVRVRMYTGYRATVAGLGRGLLPVTGGSRVMLGAFGLWHVVAYTVPLLLSRRNPRWALPLLAAALERLLVEAKTDRRQWWQAVLSPLSPLAAVPVFAHAMRRTQVWRGRTWSQ